MRALVLLTAVLVASCQGPRRDDVNTDTIAEYTAKETPLYSHEQMRFYAASRGRMYQVDQAFKKMREAQAARAKPSAAKVSAIAAADQAATAARTKLDELSKAGSTTWEPLQAGVNAALDEAERLEKAAEAIP